MIMSGDDPIPNNKSGGSGAGRIEVFTGARRRRAWSAEDKATIVEESYAGNGSVCDVARRHGLTPTQLFSWRRDARGKPAGRREAPAFVPAMIASDDAPKVAPVTQETGKTAMSGLPVMEIEVGSSHVWVWRDADIRLATALIRTLKAEE